MAEPILEFASSDLDPSGRCHLSSNFFGDTMVPNMTNTTVACAPPQVDRIPELPNHSNIPIYPMFYLLQGDYTDYTCQPGC